MINHLGIILDGNRRRAKARFLPKFAGHKAGMDNVKNISEICSKKGINYLTLWVLSVDNLEKRDKDELEGLFKLINNVKVFLGDFMKNNIKFDTIGDIKRLPEKTQVVLQDLKEETKNNSGMVLTIALVYGGQDEIVRATKKILEAGLNPDDLTRQEFRKYLDTAKLPSIDLIVRTGGDIRHSGFLLFDSEYSEYYFTSKCWPEFDLEELEKAIKSFEGSSRNFGK